MFEDEACMIKHPTVVHLRHLVHVFSVVVPGEVELQEELCKIFTSIKQLCDC